MTIQDFITKAIEGGWDIPTYFAGWDADEIKENLERGEYKVLLDPLAWRAVGKVEGKKVCICGTQGPLHTQQCPCAAIKAHATYRMHRMIDALVDGKTLEAYLETL